MTGRPTVAAALLFVPLTDTILAIVRRTLKGRHFMAADRGHIHHQLLDRGLNNWQVLAVLGGFGAATGLVAWWVSVSGSDLLGWAALGSITLLLASRKLLGAEEWSLARGRLVQSAPSWARRLSAPLRRIPFPFTRVRRREHRPDSLSRPVLLRPPTIPSEEERTTDKTRKAA